MPHDLCFRFLILALCLRLVTIASADDATYTPKIADASKGAELALSGFRLPEKTQGELVAAEPSIANPVAFHIDEQGRLYVCETFRQQKGVEDNRSHMDWLHADLALQNVEERREMFRKYLGDDVKEYSVEHDRIRLLEDTNGDGQLDKATVFADGFQDIATGTGAGVLAYKGDVFYTCIPDLWKLRDTDGDGRADVKHSLHEGYGVRVAFRGHDMHGLILGPDGRLYFSIGDRGYHVKTKDGRLLHRPDAGAVFRCETDGSNLEVFAYGLRNPQELAFDNFGNLFTGDNNSDSGDLARWVYVVEGGDTGWRMYFQYLDDRGPWNREHMWSPYRLDEETSSKQPAYIIPPIANLADGPSGLTHYPGIGLPEKYNNHFFMADFRGTASKSGIRSFANEPHGATFRLTDSKEFLWSILATDVDFGYDGRLYVTDWVNGWDGEGKGRVYRFTSDMANTSAANESSLLMREGFSERANEELIMLLGHVDQRIRQRAQFELAERGNLSILADVFSDANASQLSRIHAIWATGQILRSGTEDEENAGRLFALATDEDPEIRAQFARLANDLVGDIRKGFSKTVIPDPHLTQLASTVESQLRDKSQRVQSFAALALGKLGRASSLPAVAKFLETNNNEDPVLRHAGVMALTGIAEQQGIDQILEHSNHSSSAVRVAVLLAARRLHNGHVADFLGDRDPQIVAEAARAINDTPIDAGIAALADLANATERMGDDAVVRRVLNANLRMGQSANLKAVTKIAANAELDETIRVEALNLIAAWNEPPPLDRVNGRWWPIDDRTLDGIPDMVAPHLTGLWSGSDAIVEATIDLLAVHPISSAVSKLTDVVKNDVAGDSLRVKALNAVYSFRKDPSILTAGIASSSAELRAAARTMLVGDDLTSGLVELKAALQSGALIEKQTAIENLTNANDALADAVLLDELKRSLNDDTAKSIRLDLLVAARKRGESSELAEELLAKLKQFEATRKSDDHLAEYRECLEGGNADRGRDIFFGRSAAACRRCHVVGEEGGAVGPDLTLIGKEKTREYLLEAIVEPNREIAKGFDTVLLIMDNGKILSGMIKQESDETLTLMDSLGGTMVVEKDAIDEQAKGQSGMPDDIIQNVTKSELRDLVEYMASLNKPLDQKAEAEGHE